MSEPAEQIAALPLRRDGKDRLRVLMVTSRDTGRWVMPKGWAMDGKKPWAAAEIEALEEAGVKGHIAREAIGVYHYEKVLDDGTTRLCCVRLYPMVVQKLKRNWKERKQRRRHWFTCKAAARNVHEPELAALLLGLDETRRRHRALRSLLKAA